MLYWYTSYVRLGLTQYGLAVLHNMILRPPIQGVLCSPYNEFIKSRILDCTKQMILYRSTIRNLYHLVLVVGVWLLKKCKIFEYLSGFQGSATISRQHLTYFLGRVGGKSPQKSNLH